jgi:hypothetical protein
VAKAAKTSDDGLLLDGLRRALPGPQPLFAPRGGAGLFPGGAKGKALFERAVAEGLIEEVRETLAPPGKAKKGKEVLKGRLTDRGRQRLLEVDSPRQALEALAPALAQVATGLEHGGRPIEVPPEKIAEAAATVVRIIHDGVRGLQQTARKFIDEAEELITGLPDAVRARFGGSVQVGLSVTPEQVAALRGMLEMTTASVRTALEKAERTSPAAQSPPAAAGPDVADEIVRLVAQQHHSNPLRSLTLPELYRALHARHPGLTLLQFHDTLRGLQSHRRIALQPFTQPFTEMTDPEFALFLDREVKYYVDPA